MYPPFHLPQDPQQIEAYAKAARDMFNSIGRGAVKVAKFVALRHDPRATQQPKSQLEKPLNPR